MPFQDPQVLMVKPVSAPASEMDYNFCYRTVDERGTPQDKPARLCGLSFFAELGGHDPNSEGGLELWSSQDTTHPPAYKCPKPGQTYLIDTTPKYGLTYEMYLNALYGNGLCDPPAPPLNGHFNYVRLFLEHQSGQNVHVFQRGGNGKFNLHVIDENFLNRLAEFVQKARARGIVVCIVLTTVQGLRTEGWLAGPFHHAHNNNFNGNDPNDPLYHSTDGRKVFCDIVRPSEYDGLAACADPTYKETWTRQQKFYFIQHQLFRRVVEKTRDCWNVVYEICNEAGNEMDHVVAWHSTVAKWLDDCLRPDPQTPRQRLISISAQNDILYNPSDPADPSKLVNKLKGQVDFIGLHGGQWTNDPKTFENRCNTTAIPEPDVVDARVQTIINRFRGHEYGYALVFDADAAYWAQRSPARYVKAVSAHDGSFNYRWSVDMLSEVVNPDGPAPGGTYCKPVNGNLGLDQRLRLIRLPEWFNSKVTAFPLPAAAVPKNLAATFGSGVLRLTFGRPAPAGPTDPDTKPEGYVVFFGATAETVGQGAELFPRSQYLKPANPESPQLNLPVTLTAAPRELYVAVAAYNGPFVGELSNVAHVTLPAGTLATELVAAQLPFGAGAKVTGRIVNGSVTFKNTGTAVWQRQAPVPGGTNTCGLYMQSQDVWNESGRLFFPLPSESVLPGQTTTFQLSNMRLPYWRQPQHFKIGVAFHRVTDFESWGHFGTVYDRLPGGAPAEVEVTDPRRHATLLLERAVTPPPNTPYVDPTRLSSTPDTRNYDVISCVVTATAAPGAVVRWRVEVRNVNGQTSRFAVVSHNAAAPLGLGLKVARLDVNDIDVPPHPDTKVLAYSLTPRSQQVASLARFQNLYSVTAGTPTTPMSDGALFWYEVLSAANPPVKQVAGQSTSGAATQLTTWTNEVWENLPAGQSDPRQLTGTLTFAPGESVKYVKLSAAASHHVHLAWLTTGGGAEVRHEVVLRANAQGVFERALEITLGAHAQAVQVTYHALDVLPDVLG